MARSPRWISNGIKDGVWTIELSSWKYFHDYVRQEMLNYSHYVWRGQRDADWPLQTSLDRALQFKLKSKHHSISKAHLEKFKLAVRGRRGSNPVTINDENEWWALAQHNGMATPLLDWTESPFVALYFAFEKAQTPVSGKRAIWALGNVSKKNSEIIANHKEETPPPILEFVRPMQDENSRLVSQSGLFTKVPYGQTVESWIKAQHAGHIATAPLIKITFPNNDRPECLRTLQKMNINHLSLFPDIYGAGQYCNKALTIDKY
ncbi:FRG domain-containing protein [Pseudomonas sp. EA_35y_Pfl2_R5]|uniref:FRG domain-containing protein n=1 Tax=Pseudomonas sp. EA_35y_Pfl2_R5 TaxID=3088690 RepID=UPI0030DA1A2E